MTTAMGSKSSTVLRALKTLEIVGEVGVPVSVMDVAAKLGADRSTTYRMLMTLMEAGYIVRDDRTKRFKLSYKIVSLGRRLLIENEQTDMIQAALDELSSKTGETVNYSVLENDETVIVQQAKGTQLVSIDFQVGDRARVHCTSIGKALLAFQDFRNIERVIAAGLPKVAKNTITDPDAFRAELHRVRSQGYAVDDGEFADEMRCIAVPVFELRGRIHGGLNFSGPSSRFSDAKLDELKAAAFRVARRLSKMLGGEDWVA